MIPSQVMDCYMLVACCLRTTAETAAHTHHSCTDLQHRAIVSCDCMLSKERHTQKKVFPSTAKSCWDKLGFGTHCNCCSNMLSVSEVMLGKTSYDRLELSLCRYQNHKNLHLNHHYQQQFLHLVQLHLHHHLLMLLLKKLN